MEEAARLEEDKSRKRNWKRWGPYLSERQWSTVREDYSPDGTCWEYFPHEHARSRAYRWGEDGLLGICDRQCRLCASIALWNGHDSILKERLFGLTGSEGNHGEDCKECYYYLDSTPTHSYMKALYKYPHKAYPYHQLIQVNQERGITQPEHELEDTGVFDESSYFDVFAEYAKNTPNDVLCKYTICNRGAQKSTIHVLPTLWYRNTWIWGCTHEGCTAKPKIKHHQKNLVICTHESLGTNYWACDIASDGTEPEILFTENETNSKDLFGIDSYTPYTKDAFNRYIINGEADVVNPKQRGTKVAACYKLTVPPGGEVILRCRLYHHDEIPEVLFDQEFDDIFNKRLNEADQFYDQVIKNKSQEDRRVARQGYAGLLWSKQFYHYIVKDWLGGDRDQPAPPAARLQGRNADWKHLFNRDVISMPDKWEYPWYACWDLAFHMVPFANVDIEFSKDQLLLFLREWYMHPNGQIPAYEFALGDVNPPVHAWAVMKVFKASGPRGKRDRVFLARCFQKLMLNFTWWVNRKDPDGHNIFAGGFLGLDNIGVFDRSKPLPAGGTLQQADGTAWMAFFCVVMLDMALELAEEDPVYEDMASKFFEHFVTIADAINTFGGNGCATKGLWDNEDGFYYDHLLMKGESKPLKIRSMVGLVPLFSCLVMEQSRIEKLSGFYKRTQWFLENRKDLVSQISFMASDKKKSNFMLAIPTKEQLEHVLKYVLNEEEFLSDYGVRSLSKVHKDKPFSLHMEGEEYSVSYLPAESNTYLFGGNSNWRGPIWICMNFLLVEVLQRYDFFYGESLKVEFPTGSGNKMRLKEVSSHLSKRLCQIFLPDSSGHRPCHGSSDLYANDPFWKDLVLFYEYFDGDNGRGCGASHQTGWTALVVNLLKDLANNQDKK